MKYLITLFFLFSGCSNQPVDDNRAGCTMVKGQARYGGLTQGIKGDGDGVYIYIGKSLRGKVRVQCDQTTQAILYGGPVDITEDPEWQSLDDEEVFFYGR